MKRRLLPILFCLLLLISCTGEIGYNYLFSNETADMNVFPYLAFTCNDDKTGVYVEVVEGAKIMTLNIPNYIHTDYGTLPVTVFNGFQNPEDAEKLEVVHLPETLVGIQAGAFEKAEDLEEIYLPIILKPQVGDYGLKQDQTDIIYIGPVQKPDGSWGVDVIEEEEEDNGGFITFGYLMTSFGVGSFHLQEVEEGWALAYVEPPKGYHFVWNIDGQITETSDLVSYMYLGNPNRASCMVYNEFGEFLAWAEIAK